MSSCHHCGTPNGNHPVIYDEKEFCCSGCRLIYELISSQNLNQYYTQNNQPGIRYSGFDKSEFEFLDIPELIDELVQFRGGGLVRINLSIPQMHCSSCLYLLENLFQFHSGVKSSRVNFQRKTLSVLFIEAEISLRELVELLAQLGYKPRLRLADLGKANPTSDRALYYKLGLAGFSFGNIMLLSFPEYLGFDKASLHFFIGYINLALATPVLLYSGSDYLRSAFRGLATLRLNIDVPIALGMIALFGRSLFEIVSGNGEGFLDSFTGFVFFLLIGRWFQEFSFKSIDFDRNYTSYFPLSAQVKVKGQWISQSIKTLKKGMLVKVRYGELIPADGVLRSGEAEIDYSFVTGESTTITKSKGERVLAGGRQMGSALELELESDLEQSYLTELWKNRAFEEKDRNSTERLIKKVSQYYTVVVLCIAVLAFGYWYYFQPERSFEIVSSVLIVACPCALALAIPFTYGNVLRILSKMGYYVRSIQTIESIQDVDHIIFDKTGTLTLLDKQAVNYVGVPLSKEELDLVGSLCSNSTHRKSQALYEIMKPEKILTFKSVNERTGYGLIGISDLSKLRLGSDKFILNGNVKVPGVHIEINDVYRGYFQFQSDLRPKVDRLIGNLKTRYALSMISGDSDKDKLMMRSLFGEGHELCFRQSPQDKLDYVSKLQDSGKKVLMIGDGLNDSGALKKSDVGMVVSDDTQAFSPSCDLIVQGDKLADFDRVIKFIHRSRGLLFCSFVFAFLYNVIGLGFALMGLFSPIVAAILMPLSSLTIVAFALSSTFLLSKMILNKGA